MWVVRTVVDVLMESVSPSCVISTRGLEAAFTAIIRSITFTPRTHRHMAGEAMIGKTDSGWKVRFEVHIKGKTQEQIKPVCAE